ncbi:D-alanyl-D-alanine carboxypeptidase family protein [Ktedonobacter racemifer]|uniref:Peptidase S11 D-alanyl-D-alanine carboxypeptidase 1 n=1 Tax=Ktedonobacter racemifer DSM 44963 TaxID=485913 RepID=D6TVU9_KTERA|nr:serine hydrolase [Ktedonobacter racemifer]EFH84332.1 peptidase S11 D-alanyl-D-alanine carboxypeptidase 1 [Ktedonobacter racemifer DSM 44963]
MDHHDEKFAPETVDEQIELHLQQLPIASHTSLDTRMLKDLQQIAEQDVQRIAQVRARLARYALENGEKRKPIDLREYQAETAPPLHSGFQPRKRKAPGARRRLVTVLTGLVAVLLLASMLTVFARVKPQQEQTHPKIQHQTSTVVAKPVLHGSNAFLLDADMGTVLVDVNGHARVSVAHFTKYMVAITALENADPNQMITIDQASLDAVPKGLSTAQLVAGDQIPLHDLLNGLLLPSGNDAAGVIARAVGGDPQNFVAMMNEEARQLQLNDTHFNSPYAISSADNYTSAADLASMMRYGMQLEVFSEDITGTIWTLQASAYNHAYVWENVNLPQVNEPGVESGHDKEIGYHAIFTPQSNGHLLIGVEINAPSPEALNADVSTILRSVKP